MAFHNVVLETAMLMALLIQANLCCNPTPPAAHVHGQATLLSEHPGSKAEISQSGHSSLADISQGRRDTSESEVGPVGL